MALNLIVTNAGRAALVNAANTGTNSVEIAKIGVSATAVVPSAAATTLPGEIKKLTTFGGAGTADDVIHLVIQDESEAVYTLRSFALYLADNTLFAIYGQATPIMEKSAAALMLLAVDITLADISATAITFGATGFINPAATTETAGVVERATNAEAAALIDALRYVTPAQIGAIFTAANTLSRLLTVDGAGSGLDGDTLDGQHGAWYADIPARLGFTPLNATSYTAVDVRAKLHTVDGSGSGVDADMLDGQEGSYYTNIIARLGYTPLNMTAYTASDVFAKVLTLDGSGSGLDGDTLDGQHGPWYADIPARLGFNPLNATAYTAADVRAKLLTVDGAGSGVDADLLDGLDASYFVNIPARLGFNPANRAGDTFTGNVVVTGTGSVILATNGDVTASREGGTTGVVFLGSGSGRYLYFDGSSYIMPTSPLYVNGGLVWTSVNDGAGSGSDADLLDGQHGSFYTDIIGRLGYTPVNVAYYTPSDVLAKLLTVDGSGSGLDADTVDGWHRDDLRQWGWLLNVPGSFPPSAHGHGAGDILSAFTQSLGASGYIVLPGGFAMQWGAYRGYIFGQVSVAITYPVSFTACYTRFAIPYIAAGATNRDLWSQVVGAAGLNGTSFHFQSNNNDNLNVDGFDWFAIGRIG